MTITLIAQVATPKGLIQHRDLAGDIDPWTLPANSYERAQRRVPVLVAHDHDWCIGEVVYYERSRYDGLLAVAQLHTPGPLDTDDPDDWYVSPEVRSRRCGIVDYGHGVIAELSIIRRTASIGTHPLRWSPNSGTPHGMPLRWHQTWQRAHAAIAHEPYVYRRDDTLRIVDIDKLDLVDEVLCDPEVAARVKAEAAAFDVRAKAASALRAKKTRAAAAVSVSSSRADAENYAAEHGLGGYSWSDSDGERHHVRYGGTLNPL
jgi:hypothetical protein